MTKKQKLEAEKLEAKNRVLEQLEGVGQVYTVLKYISYNGMNRVIQVVYVKDGSIIDCSYFAAKALGWGYSENHRGIKVSGAGMDMGCHLVYSLSHVLYGDGYNLNQRWL